MGFDLHGINVKGERGDYFRANVWGWKPIWDFVSVAADDILTKEDIKNGNYNNFHEITENKADALAERIDFYLKNGQLHEYVKAKNEYLESLPLEKCHLCKGTGRRKKPPVVGAGDYMECNACRGKGEVKQWETHYPVDIDDILRFSIFAGESGGFQIG